MRAICLKSKNLHSDCSFIENNLLLKSYFSRKNLRSLRLNYKKELTVDILKAVFLKA